MFEFLTPKISGFGIDLSDLSIKIIQLTKKRGCFTVNAFGRQEIPPGLIEEGEIKKEGELIELIRKAVRETKPSPPKTRYCIASLPETESFARMVRLPLMKEEEAAEAIKWKLEEYIPLSFEEIYYDWQIIPSPVGKRGPDEHLNILIGVLPKKTIDPYLAVLKKAGLKPFIFEIESAATARALIKDDFSSQPLMIIDFGAARTSFLIFYGQTIYFTASLPLSNNSLVAALSERLNVSQAKAKAIKTKVGLDEHRLKSPIYQTLKTPLIEAAGKIKSYIDFFHEHILPSKTPQEQIKEILLCGGGANLAGLSEFLSRQLNLNVRLGNPWVNIAQPNEKELTGLPPNESLCHTTALGLALRGYQE